MQTRSQIDKFCLPFIFFFCNGTNAQISNDHVSYALVDRNGVAFQAARADTKKGMFLRQSRPDGRFTDFKIPEFDSMNKKHGFDFELLDGSLISSPQGDYFVVESMRSIASNPEEDADYVKHPLWWKHRCGHGVHLTYLVGVTKKNVRIVERYFTECSSEARISSAAGKVGYEIKGYGDDAGKSVLYILQKNGSFVKKENGPFQENIK